MNVDLNRPSEQIINASSLTVALPRPAKKFYRHGWQSWSLTAWTGTHPFPIQKPQLFHPLQTDPLYANDKLPNGSWVGAVEFDDGEILLLGALGADAHVRLNGGQLQGWYESEGGDWLVARGKEPEVFSRYADELGKRFGRSKDKSAPRVWCSWYGLYEKIDEKRLYKIFDDLAGYPFDVLQVDDGWQVSVGDWEANKKFPSGMKALAEKIKSTGKKAGLWLAPLTATKSSRLFHEHPDWFLHDEKGRFVSAGFNWHEQVYALDVTHLETLQWLERLMKQVRAWGFDYLKLDFLYAGALPGKRFREMPREAAYRDALAVMRQAMGDDAFLLACGAPIIPSLGLCDAIRVGPDVSASWESYRDAVLLYNFTTPGTKNAIRTTIHRLWLSPLIHIDSDAAYFRSKKIMLSGEQKRSLQELALICGYKTVSDLPEWLTDEEKNSLQNFLVSKPVIEQSGRYAFNIDGRRVDFSFAVPLPQPAKGLAKIKSHIAGWAGNQKWILNLFLRLAVYIAVQLNLSLRP
jgi:alpha-galactosidase